MVTLKLVGILIAAIMVVTAVVYTIWSLVVAPVTVGANPVNCGIANSGGTANTTSAVKCFYNAYTNFTNATMSYDVMAPAGLQVNNLSLVVTPLNNIGKHDERIWDTIITSTAGPTPTKRVINCFNLQLNSSYLTIDACSGGSTILIPNN